MVVAVLVVVVAVVAVATVVLMLVMKNLPERSGGHRLPSKPQSGVSRGTSLFNVPQ